MSTTTKTVTAPKVKPNKKALQKLGQRLRGHASMCTEADRRSAGSSKGYTTPGSLNPRKQG